MDGDSIGILSFMIILLIGGSAYFSASEVAFSSVNKIRIKNKADNGDTQAKKALLILDNFEKALVTILIGNNIMNITCASLTAFLVSRIWGINFVALATIIMTILVIFTGELFPKSLAKAYNTEFVLKTAWFLFFLMKILTPLSYLFEKIGTLATSLLSFNQKPTVTEDELLDIIKTIEDEGTIDEEQSELLQSAVEFNVTRVSDVYTPLAKVISLSTDMNDDKILSTIIKEGYSRYPVYEKGRIIGILQTRQYLKNHVANRQRSIRSLMTKIYYVSKERLIDDLLSDMSRIKVHMGIVIDDEKQVIGIITIEDILEELVGEIWDENDEVLDYFMELGGNRFEVNADLLVNRVFDLIKYPIDKKRFNNMTMLDWVKQEISLEPEEDDEFEYENLVIRVSNIENNQIKKIIVKIKEEDDHE
ncbi:MAG: hemolysin family protein [Erysipelotrichaceae bacterium]|nr:hemolysin family protein [Erysipelotrichaceae bacterium]MDD4643293.1 hemolysin family protein [Erysipelotrichaceae bacterium]